ncbi:dihydrolipoyl dehydrogenase [Salinicola salarius]|uniref:dihydrolipoyl dehydrogenase n=1 Tax=Salinicola salarius TaxID=430457 RepID=UPI000B3FE6B7|nr:dihydrolipoyl dehydrogenase [Salinicola salarius]
MERYQVLIIGAGPGGYVAAIRAAQLGLRTAIVERAELGGVCLNWGCIPTKTLLRSAELLRQAREGADYGLVLDAPPQFDLQAAVKRSRTVAGQLNRGVRGLLKKNQVSVLTGHARLQGQGRVVIEGEQGVQEVSAVHIILATGARPRALPNFEPDGKLIWTAREAMTPPALPNTLTVIGAGAIGVEFASFYATVGSKVTLLEAAERILPVEDAEISAMLAERLRKQGIDVRTQAMVESKQAQDDGLQITFSEGGAKHSLDAERVILAAGIVGNVEGLGLEQTAVRVEKSHIVVDRWSATDEPGVYAIGDVAGPPWLAHKASHEGVACIERIAGLVDAHALDPEAVPSCTYCHPQVASVGLTEARAREHGHAVTVGRFAFVGNGKALALGDSQGFVKTVMDAHSGELLGAHLIGPDVTELIGTYALGRTLETTELEIMRTVFPHPTLSEALHESVLGAFERPMHV